MFGDTIFSVPANNYYEFVVVSEPSIKVIACYQDVILRLFRIEYQDSKDHTYWRNDARYTLLDAMACYQDKKASGFHAE